MPKLESAKAQCYKSSSSCPWSASLRCQRYQTVAPALLPFAPLSKRCRPPDLLETCLSSSDLSVNSKRLLFGAMMTGAHKSQLAPPLPKAGLAACVQAACRCAGQACTCRHTSWMRSSYYLTLRIVSLPHIKAPERGSEQGRAADYHY